MYRKEFPIFAVESVAFKSVEKDHEEIIIIAVDADCH
jgi:hypothetical protein